MTTTSNNDIARAIYSLLKDKGHEKFSDVSNKVVKFLVRKRLLLRSKDILKRLKEIINHEEGRILVKLSSAQKIKEETKKSLISFLEKKYKAKEVIFIENLDEKLLGGVRMEIKDEVIDLTIKNKIGKLQEYLIRKK